MTAQIQAPPAIPQPVGYLAATRKERAAVDAVVVSVHDKLKDAAAKLHVGADHVDVLINGVQVRITVEAMRPITV